MLSHCQHKLNNDSRTVLCPWFLSSNPLLDAHAGTLGQMPYSFVSKQPFVSKWVAFEKWGSFGMGSFPQLLKAVDYRVEIETEIVVIRIAAISNR